MEERFGVGKSGEWGLERDEAAVTTVINYCSSEMLVEMDQCWR